MRADDIWKLENVEMWKSKLRDSLQVLRTTRDSASISQEIRTARLVLGRGRMNQQQLRDRTKEFAKQVVRLCRRLPKDWDIRELGKQLLRSATSVAANYRACGRARSDKEFCSKLGVVVEEADESQLWIELVKEAYPKFDTQTYNALFKEATELTAIFTASHRTARANLKQKKEERKKGRAR